MKMNKQKIIVSTLALAMGAALAGSVSGTVAWFQYSTRAQVSFMGTSGHCSELLQVSVDGGSTWKGEFATADFASLDHNGSKVVPITSGGVAKNEELNGFYANPIYQISAGAYANWTTADDASYLQFTLKFKVIDVNENYDAADPSTADLLEKPLYLTDLTLEDTAGGDLEEALRVHINNGTSNFLIANTATSTTTNGSLDLNNDNVADQTEGYEWSTDRETITYGEGTQTSYAKSSIVAADNNGVISGGQSIGTVGDDGAFTLTITVWLEGWQPLANGVGGSSSTIWNASDYVGVDFHVGMRFAVPLHADHA